MLETERLVLRRWEDGDASDLYEYAKDPDVGPIAGWPPHQSIEESREVIKNVFTGREAYAVCLKTDGKAIGAIELKLNGYTDMTDRDDNCLTSGPLGCGKRRSGKRARLKYLPSKYFPLEIRKQTRC